MLQLVAPTSADFTHTVRMNIQWKIKLVNIFEPAKMRRKNPNFNLNWSKLSSKFDQKEIALLFLYLKIENSMIISLLMWIERNFVRNVNQQPIQFRKLIVKLKNWIQILLHGNRSACFNLIHDLSSKIGLDIFWVNLEMRHYFQELSKSIVATVPYHISIEYFQLWHFIAVEMSTLNFINKSTYRTHYTINFNANSTETEVFLNWIPLKNGSYQPNLIVPISTDRMEQSQPDLTHHNRLEYCKNRLSYRDGRKLTAVKVNPYAFISEDS